VIDTGRPSGRLTDSIRGPWRSNANSCLSALPRARPRFHRVSHRDRQPAAWQVHWSAVDVTSAFNRYCRLTSSQVSAAGPFMDRRVRVASQFACAPKVSRIPLYLRSGRRWDAYRWRRCRLACPTRGDTDGDLVIDEGRPVLPSARDRVGDPTNNEDGFVERPEVGVWAVATAWAATATRGPARWCATRLPIFLWMARRRGIDAARKRGPGRQTTPGQDRRGRPADRSGSTVVCPIVRGPIGVLWAETVGPTVARGTSPSHYRS